jgi:hypothetical protein
MLPLTWELVSRVSNRTASTKFIVLFLLKETQDCAWEYICKLLQDESGGLWWPDLCADYDASSEVCSDWPTICRLFAVGAPKLTAQALRRWYAAYLRQLRAMRGL